MATTVKTEQTDIPLKTVISPQTEADAGGVILIAAILVIGIPFTQKKTIIQITTWKTVPTPTDTSLKDGPVMRKILTWRIIPEEEVRAIRANKPLANIKEEEPRAIRATLPPGVIPEEEPNAIRTTPSTMIIPEEEAPDTWIILLLSEHTPATLTNTTPTTILSIQIIIHAAEGRLIPEIHAPVPAEITPAREPRKNTECPIAIIP